MGQAVVLLSAFHLLLFRRFYFQNPYVYATSEALEQGFPSWVLLGRCLRRHGVVADQYYYPDYRALPFLSAFYPPHRVTAWLGTFLSTDQAWVLYVGTMVAHFWLSSVSVYMLAIAMGAAPLSAGFASVTLSTLGYAMKQNSSIVYTAAWVPVAILTAVSHNTALFGISLGMMLLAGYWPIALYTIPLACCCWLWPSAS